MNMEKLSEKSITPMTNSEVKLMIVPCLVRSNGNANSLMKTICRSVRL